MPRADQLLSLRIESQVRNVAIAGGQRSAECPAHPRRSRHSLPDAQSPR